MANYQKTRIMTIAGLLSAIGIVIPMFMPKIILGPMSFTLASHVAIFIAMFISPVVAVTVAVGTTIGFFLTTPPIIALRAASHLIFALLGAWILKKNPDILKNPVKTGIFAVAIALIHAVSELIVVTPFFLSGSALFKPEQLTNGYLLSVFILVGCGTAIHSIIDFIIAWLIWQPLRRFVHNV